MSTERTVLQRRYWRQMIADVEEISRLLTAGERLLLASCREPRYTSRRGLEEHGARKQQFEILEKRETYGRNAASTRQRDGQQEKGTRAQEAEKLIPGLPDDVVLNHILTKIGWAKLVSLSSVSRSWHDIINQREVHNSRLRTSSTQTFIAMVHETPRFKSAGFRSLELPFRDFLARFHDDNDPYVPPDFHLSISLYDPSAHSWHLLPPIPQVKCGIPPMSACVFVSGRLYILGGEGQRNMRCTPRKSVFMMDLVVGHGVWRECASMRFGRSDFACGVIDGKIYVAGGWSNLDHVWIEGEVFDPEQNSWQRIVDMPIPRLNYTVGILDKQMYVIGGSVFRSFSDDDNNDPQSDEEEAEWADVYDPCENQWRRMEMLGSYHKVTCILSNYGLCYLSSDAIVVYDRSSESWRPLISNSWEVLESTGALFCSPCAAIDANGEVFAFVRWLKGWPYEVTLMKARGFPTMVDVAAENPPPLRWETVTCPHEFNRDFFFLVPVQL